MQRIPFVPFDTYVGIISRVAAVQAITGKQLGSGFNAEALQGIVACYDIDSVLDSVTLLFVLR